MCERRVHKYLLGMHKEEPDRGQAPLCACQVLFFGDRTPVACKKLTPVFLLQLDIKLFSSMLDALPGFISLLVGHIFHLVKACYSLLDMTRIYKRLLALFRKGKSAFRQFLSLFIS